VFGGSFTLHGLEVEPFCVRSSPSPSSDRRSRSATTAEKTSSATRSPSSGSYPGSTIRGATETSGNSPDEVSRRKVVHWLKVELGRSTWRFGNGYVYEREQFVFLDAAAGGDRLAPSTA
jgi:hypothetical protein